MDKKRLLREILEQTQMMESALDAEDFEVFEQILEYRGELISRYEDSAEANPAEATAVMDTVGEIHLRCVGKLASLKHDTEKIIEDTRKERLQLSKRSDAQSRYQGMDSFGIFDTKK